jgi:hypothetical protein
MPTLQEICNQILDTDKSIRFVGIANQMGRPVASASRAGLELVLTKDEIDSYMIKIALQMKTAEDAESKLGHVVYTLVFYSKLKRVIIPLKHPDFSLLVVSFDVSANHEGIVMNKILPLVKDWTGNIASQA